MGYSGTISTAVGWWDSKTDVSLYNSSTSNLIVVANNYGYTSWDGQSDYGWDNNNYFLYSTLKFNRYHTDGYISSGNQLRLNLVAAHEFGHSLWLDHNMTDFVMMFGGDVWNAYLQNNSLANGPAFDDINGMNSIY